MSINQEGVSIEHIPFNSPSIVGNEVRYIEETVRRKHTSGDGLFTKKSEEFLKGLLGVPRVLLTTSCTHALEMAALLLDIQPGDEVIVPSFTFVSTANAFVLRGARIVFADIRPDTLNIDESKIESIITPRTKVIVPVHYAGIACEMDTLASIAEKQGISIVEDNAHGIFGKYKGRWLGTLGQLATQSFHETKNIACGEGGALIINDAKFIDRAEILREKGTNRRRFFNGLVDKYTWVDLGSSYILSEILAAFLYAQLENWEISQAARKLLWTGYANELSSWAASEGIQLPVIPEHVDPSYHLFHLVMPSQEKRDALIEHLRREDINAVFHYLPLHNSPMGRSQVPSDCPVTERVSRCLVRLPLYNGLNSENQQRVITSLRNFG